MKPRYANTWYSDVPVTQLRQEIQAIYEEVGKLSGGSGGGGGSSVDLSKYLPLTGGNITGSLGINTATPLRRLDVMQADPNNSDGVFIRSTGTTGHLWAGTGGFVIDVTDGDQSAAANFHIRTGNADRFRVLADGEVKLHRQATNADEAVRADRSISAGNGLSGGGNLTADRTITLGTPGTLSTATTNSVTSTSHTHSVTFPVTGAGNGLTLSSSNIGLGTPSTITSATTNSVTSTSHTHNLTLPSTLNHGVGAYAIMQAQASVNANATVAGSSLRYASFVAGGGVTLSSTTPTGTWRNLGGNCVNGTLALFVRTA